MRVAPLDEILVTTIIVTAMMYAVACTLPTLYIDDGRPACTSIKFGSPMFGTLLELVDNARLDNTDFPPCDD